MLFPIADVTIDPLLLLLLGLIVGTLSGFFGVGGGFLISGGLLVMGVPPIFAVGTGLTLIMGSSIINTLKHRSFGHLDLKLGLLMVIGTIPALFLAEWLLTYLESVGASGDVIRYVYVIVLAGLAIFIGFDYWRSRRAVDSMRGEVSTSGLARRVQSLRIPPHSIKIPGLPPVSTYVSLPVSRIDRISVFVPISAGFVAGFFAGLLGAGGGTVLMPLLIFVMGVPTTVAIGTDLFQIIITGSVGTFIKSFAGHVDPVMVVIMLVAASAGAQLGSAATRIIEAARIRILYGVIVLAGSVAVAMEQAAQSFSSEFLSDLAIVVLLGVSGTICLVIAGMMVAAKWGRSARQTRADGGNSYHSSSQQEEPGRELAATEPKGQEGDN